MPKRKKLGELTDNANDNQIGFRLEPHYLALLEQRAKLAGSTKGGLSKIFVIEALNQDSQLEALRQRLLAVEGSLNEIRRDIRLSTQMLLMFAGKTPQDKAADWVAKIYNPPKQTAMLSISPPMRGSGKANYYLDLAREDYYLEGGEPLGKWHGQGASALGLSGTVGKNDLRRLMHGHHPVTGAKLVQNAGDKDRQSGWDLTFSAPKSVSVAWAQAEPEIRAKFQVAQERAVQQALGYLQAAAGLTRRGKEGLVAEKAMLIAATFEHGTSRAQDPDLHTHALVLNIAVREDGTTGTIRSLDLFRHKMAAGAFYRAALAAGLQGDLGLEIQRDGRSFSLAGVPKSLCDFFSKRSQEIEAAMKEKGVSGPVAAKVAALETRQVKEHVSRDTLFAYWRNDCLDQGWSMLDFEKLLGRATPVRHEEQVCNEIVFESLATLLTGQSYFAERDLVRGAAELAPGRGVSAEKLLSAINTAILAPEFTSIGVLKGERLFAATETLAVETDLMKTVAQGQESTAHVVSPRKVRSVIRKHPHLSGEQREAIKHITGQPGSVKLVCGMAGTGKSTMLDVARRAWQKAGYRVLGTSLSGKAARGLEESANIHSVTIAKALFDLNKGPFGLHVRQKKLFPKIAAWTGLSNITLPVLAIDLKRLQLDSKTVLVVDEAGMVDTHQMKALVDEAAKAGAKLVLVGDDRQLQPIDAGGPFRAFLKNFGHASLTEIKRQRDQQDKDLVNLAADGRGRDVLAKAKERNLLHTAAGSDQTRKLLIEYWRTMGVRKPEQNVIITATREAASALNGLAQDERIKAGKLSSSSVKVGQHYLHPQDRVLFTKNSKPIGVCNGDLGTVLKVSRETLTVRLDSGKKITVPLDSYTDVQLGYAMTTHKGQGMTTENSFVLLGLTMQDRELSYVQASRARGTTRFFVDSTVAGKEFEDIGRIMSQSHQKELAIQLQIELRKQEQDARDTRQRQQEDAHERLKRQKEDEERKQAQDEERRQREAEEERKREAQHAQST